MIAPYPMRKIVTPRPLSAGKMALLLFLHTVLFTITGASAQYMSGSRPNKKAKLPPKDLKGELLERARYSFSVSSLKGASVLNPTSLQFGPDGRLYVAQQDGIIKVLTIIRRGPGDYQATSEEVIDLINQIPNHNDDGSPAPGIPVRQVTGLLVTGTAASPVLYVGSSDSRMGGPWDTGGADPNKDVNLDSNSGIISRLTKTPGGWDKVDLVRGLPRSEENHSVNGLQLDAQTNVLYASIGGFTNAGAPSASFALASEFALAAAILSIDLKKIDAMPTAGTGNTKYKYNIPTLDDPTRTNLPNGTDVGDPFGGNDGLNQTKIVPGGPVQVYAPGFRNAYDLVITQTPGKARRMYAIDNGANQGWGGHPDSEGGGDVTNNYPAGEPGSFGPGKNDPQVNNLDNLHYIGNLDTYKPGSMYAGHPNPIRANPAGAGLYTAGSGKGVWRTSKTGPDPLPADWPPVPLELANPVEGDFRNPGEANNAMLTFTISTNGIAEYTASAFDNRLKGNLLTACFDGNIYRITLNESGTEATNPKGKERLIQDFPFASGFGKEPIDVTAQGDNDIFPGTVWAVTYLGKELTVFEPQPSSRCSGTYSRSVDDDGDGYSNADEIDNLSNPCSAASRPVDSDSDLISDLNDNDNDNDGIPDYMDAFAVDAKNGLDTKLPLKYDLYNGDPGTGLYGVGFTGLMVNKNPGYNLVDLYDEQNLIAGGAVGAFSVVQVTPGDALGRANNQENAFQFGINTTALSGVFDVQARMLGPFFNGKKPQNHQSQGVYIGTGDQDNYLKVALIANGGRGGIEVVYEQNGVARSTVYPLAGGVPDKIMDLYLTVDPATGIVQPKYSLEGGLVFPVGSPVVVRGALLTAIQEVPALAVGIIATSRGAGPFTASWDFVTVANETWQPLPPKTGTPTERHENAYVKAGDKFYLLGGRGLHPVQVYDPVTQAWTSAAPPPFEMHHFQAVSLNGLIYVLGAFTGEYPGEQPVPNVYIYNPATNAWATGPAIPVARRRGAAGVAVYNNKIYLAGGIVNGHNGGFVPWLDEFDPATGVWRALPDAPRARDHFHAAVIGTKLYAAGGRRTSAGTGQIFELTIPEVDAYDFSTGSWTTLPIAIPTQRGGSTAVAAGNELIVIGGESGVQETAHQQTEALNVTTNVWRRLADLKQGRHGTQAIASGDSLYIAAGSANRGGGPELSSQEVLSLAVPERNATSGSQIGSTFRINAGGEAYTAMDGSIFSADQYAMGGETYTTVGTNDIAGTDHDELYRSERFGEFGYHFPTGNGTFKVILHFAETFWGVAVPRANGCLV